MSDTTTVCYTFEGALEQAIRMEEDGFRNYLAAIRMLQNRQAREILKDSALDELGHKYQLEKALIEGNMDAGGDLSKPVPTMNLDYVLSQETLSPDAGPREALAFAIHLEKEAIDFYSRLTTGCAGAPMAPLFQRLLADETRHLQSLEDLYERYFMTEN